MIKVAAASRLKLLTAGLTTAAMTAQWEGGGDILGCIDMFSGNQFCGPQKPFLPGFLRIYFCPVFLEKFFTGMRFWRGLEIPVFSRFHRIILQEFLLDRDSCICTGFLRIPLDSC
jgi:hypothetical protein